MKKVKADSIVQRMLYKLVFFILIFTVPISIWAIDSDETGFVNIMVNEPKKEQPPFKWQVYSHLGLHLNNNQGYLVDKWEHLPLESHSTSLGIQRSKFFGRNRFFWGIALEARFFTKTAQLVGKNGARIQSTGHALHVQGSFGYRPFGTRWGVSISLAPEIIKSAKSKISTGPIELDLGSNSEEINALRLALSFFYIAHPRWIPFITIANSNVMTIFAIRSTATLSIGLNYGF